MPHVASYNSLATLSNSAQQRPNNLAILAPAKHSTLDMRSAKLRLRDVLLKFNDKTFVELIFYCENRVNCDSLVSGQATINTTH